MSFDFLIGTDEANRVTLVSVWSEFTIKISLRSTAVIRQTAADIEQMVRPLCARSS